MHIRNFFTSYQHFSASLFSLNKFFTQGIAFIFIPLFTEIVGVDFLYALSIYLLSLALISSLDQGLQLSIISSVSKFKRISEKHYFVKKITFSGIQIYPLIIFLVLLFVFDFKKDFIFFGSKLESWYVYFWIFAFLQIKSLLNLLITSAIILDEKLRINILNFFLSLITVFLISISIYGEALLFFELVISLLIIHTAFIFFANKFIVFSNNKSGLSDFLSYRKYIKEILYDSRFLTLSNILWFLTAYIDKLIILSFSSDEQFTFLMLATVIASIPVIFISSANRFLLNIFASENLVKFNKDNYKKFKKYFFNMTLIAILITLVISVHIKGILGGYFNINISSDINSWALELYPFAFLFIALSSMINMGLIILKKQKLIFKISLLFSITQILIGYLVFNFTGINGLMLFMVIFRLLAFLTSASIFNIFAEKSLYKFYEILKNIIFIVVLSMMIIGANKYFLDLDLKNLNNILIISVCNFLIISFVTVASSSFEEFKSMFGNEK